LKKKLKNATDMVYQRLTKGTSRARHCQHSSLLGELAGKELNINPAVNNHSKNSGAYLSFFG